MVTRSKFLWPGSERRHCRRQGEHTRPGCIARRPRRAQPAVARAQMEGGVKGSYHYHRKEPRRTAFAMRLVPWAVVL